MNIDLGGSNLGNTQNGSSTPPNQASLPADLDVNTEIPLTKLQNPDAVAVVIGNSSYAYAKPVTFAQNDAATVKSYLINTLGFREGNILYLPNIYKSKFEAVFGTRDNFKGLLYNMVKKNTSDVIVFYSGHGGPGINDKKAYLIPVECEPNNVELEGYPLETLYNNVGRLEARSVSVVLDACFSGAEMYSNISPINVQVNPDNLQNGVVLSSCSAAQAASWYPARQHGLFTYFFLKALKDHSHSDSDHNNRLTWQELYNYISDNQQGIPYYARFLNQITQTPTLQGAQKEAVLADFR